MTVPPFGKFLYPFLKALEDGADHNTIEIQNKIAVQLDLTEADLAERTPAGYLTRFNDRVKWARTYFLKAGLITSPERGNLRITDSGKELLRSRTEITLKTLEQYPGYREFKGLPPLPPHIPPPSPPEEPEATPEELIEQHYNELRANIAQELLEKVKESTPAFFEQLVIDLLLAMGYGGSRKDAGEAIGMSHDGGIDGLIKQDKLGLEVIYIQAKKWENTVGRPHVQGFAGSLDGVRAKKGVFITTSKFSRDAEEYVSRIDKKIVLIDGAKLTQLMLDHGIGVSTVYSLNIQKMDLDYFEAE